MHYQIQLPRFITLTLLLISLGKTTFSQEYLSAAVMIPADRFLSLKGAYDANPIHRLGLTTHPIAPNKYHLTLVGMRIELLPSVSSEQKSHAQKTIQAALHDITSQKLASIHEHPISMPFMDFKVFRNKIVAHFALTDELEALIKDMHNSFENHPAIQELIKQGTITTIRPLHKIIEPHVSLATIEGRNGIVGTEFPTTARVSDFKISKNNFDVSVKCKKRVTQRKPKHTMMQSFLRASFVLGCVGLAFYLWQKYR